MFRCSMKSDLIVFSIEKGAVRIGSINEKLIVNPTRQEMKKSDLNLVISVNEKGELGNEENSETFVSTNILISRFSDDRRLGESFLRGKNVRGAESRG